MVNKGKENSKKAKGEGQRVTIRYRANLFVPESSVLYFQKALS